MSKLVVETKYGKVEGRRVNRISVWKGVPFAKPPVGSLRFRAPTEMEPWTGVLQCTDYSPAAPQNVDTIMTLFGNPIKHKSEDCLYLNIWSPAADDHKRPVLVWIHGGAFRHGAGIDPWFDGTSFAENGDVVLVTINYRMGVFGFLYLEEILGRDYESSGINGILDQVAALRWVHENIENFGGDPGRVTIFGQSAGAASVGTLLVMPSAKGLFQQAILQSGTANINRRTREQALELTSRVLSELDVSALRLSEVSMERLLEVQSTVQGLGFGPFADGAILPSSPLQAMEQGYAKDVPLIIGTTHNESRLFFFEDESAYQLNESELIQRIQNAYGPIPNEVFQAYRNRAQAGATPIDTYLPVIDDYVFTRNALQLADLQAELGGDVWMYRFDWPSPAYNRKLLASHSIELPFVFHTLTKPGVTQFTGDSSVRQKVADEIHQAWIDFARNGNPNWVPYDTENRATKVFDLHSRIEYDPSAHVRDIFKFTEGDSLCSNA